MKSILLLTCLFMVLFYVMACDDDDDNDDNNDESEDDDNNSDDDNNDDNNNNTDDDDNDNDDTFTEEVWLDASTNLMWQVDWFSPIPWGGSVEYCEMLKLADYNDWRLPTIAELRSLVQGCDDTATGGACTVTDSCLESSCENAACDGCNGIPGPNQGCYGNPAFPGECYGFWSISEVEDQDDSAWLILYNEAVVMQELKNCDDGCEYLARCVRNAE